ncbi:MAG: hypothetical protein ABIH64_07575 [Nanoarchaeota archaeon]
MKQVEMNYLSRSIRPKLIAARMISQENILERINKRTRREQSLIEFNLSNYGYEMISIKRKKHKKLPIEELIVEIIIKYPSARFIEAIPFLIIKNKIGGFKLLELATRYGIKNKVGYLIETVFMIRPIPQLKGLLDYLIKNKENEMSFLVEGDEEFLRKTSPERVRKWNLLGRFFDEDFKKLAKVYL